MWQKLCQTVWRQLQLVWLLAFLPLLTVGQAWASLGKVGQDWASLGKETQQEWQRFSPLENKWARASFVSPPSAHRLVHRALVDQQMKILTQTQILMGMGAFSFVATGHSHKEELTDKYRAWENWFLDTTRRLFKEIVFHSMTQKLIEGLKSISLHLWIFSIQWSLP